MLIKAQITYNDEKQSDLLGVDVNQTDEILLDLSDVSAVMPGDKNQQTTIVFLHGRDILISMPYQKVAFAWMKTKEDDGRMFHTFKNEG